MMTSAPWSRADAWTHRFAVFSAVLTFILLCSGGLVTSHGVGMSVPDWPNSFGYNMFAFPVSHWVGGIFFEHSHRLLATSVGFFTALFALMLWARETTGNKRSAGVLSIVFVLALLVAGGLRPESAPQTSIQQVNHTVAVVAIGVGVLVLAFIGFSFWQFSRETKSLRWLGLAASATVLLQGVLGGLRVVLHQDEIGIFHGVLAQSFFCGIAFLAVITSRAYREKRWAPFEPHPDLRYWALAGTVVIFFQLSLGATMRHEHNGLSISDFPLAYGHLLPDTSAASLEKINAARVEAGALPTTAGQIWLQMLHRFTALCIAGLVAVIWVKSRRATPASARWSRLWIVMICAQIGLGAWTVWSNKAADIATSHMALGALSLMVGMLFAFRLFRGARSQDFAWPDPPARPMIHVA